MYAVVWKDAALDELADVYVAADPADRARMAAGVEALNTRLAADPLDEGESRGGTRRIAFPDLLAVSFTIDPVDRVVRVTAVARYGR